MKCTSNIFIVNMLFVRMTNLFCVIVVSAKQVENQILSLEEELSNFEMDFGRK